jgi:hypothetical protein
LPKRPLRPGLHHTEAGRLLPVRGPACFATKPTQTVPFHFADGIRRGL